MLSFFFRNYGPKRWRMAVWDMVRRLMPCFLLATCELPAQVLLGALIVSCGFMVRDRGSYVRHAFRYAFSRTHPPVRPSPPPPQMSIRFYGASWTRVGICLPIAWATFAKSSS